MSSHTANHRRPVRTSPVVSMALPPRLEHARSVRRAPGLPFRCGRPAVERRIEADERGQVAGPAALTAADVLDRDGGCQLLNRNGHYLRRRCDGRSWRLGPVPLSALRALL